MHNIVLFWFMVLWLQLKLTDAAEKSADAKYVLINQLLDRVINS